MNRSIALRKIKSLGPQRNLPLIKPGGIFHPLPKSSSEYETEEEQGLDDLPTLNSKNIIPPHEPLVLWQDSEDPSNVIKVIPEICCKLRPHQREGVQFLFECTMGLRGFEGEVCNKTII